METPEEKRARRLAKKVFIPYFFKISYQIIDYLKMPIHVFIHYAKLWHTRFNIFHIMTLNKHIVLIGIKREETKDADGMGWRIFG